jgi:hypothetical protein
MPTLDQRLDEFEKHGPFTFERAFTLVKLCAKSKDTDFHDSLTNVLHKFPAEELEKIFKVIGDESQPNNQVWEKGCSFGQFSNYNGEFDAKQLEAIAKSKIDLQVDCSDMDVEDRLAILLVENRHLQKQRAAKKRDKSPSRK